MLWVTMSSSNLRAKKQSLKININILVIRITQSYSVKYSRHNIVNITVLKILLLEIQGLNNFSNSSFLQQG